MGFWRDVDTFRRTDAAVNTAKAAKSTEEAAWRQVQLQQETAHHQAEAAQHAKQAADEAKKARWDQIEYHYRMWMQSADGQRYLQWQKRAADRMDKIAVLQEIWYQAWTEAARTMVGPPLTQEQVDRHNRSRERARALTGWCATISIGVILLNALLLHSGLLGWLFMLLLAIGVPIGGVRYLYLRQHEIVDVYRAKLHAFFGFNPFEPAELPPWDVEQAAWREHQELKQFVIDAITRLPTTYPPIDRHYTVRPPTQAPHPVPQALEHLRAELHHMGQPL